MAIGESELAALTALSMLEERGITRHHFGVYCGKTREPLDSIDDLNQLRDKYYCENCDEDHEAKKRTRAQLLEVHFTVDMKKLRQFISGRCGCLGAIMGPQSLL